MRILTFSEYMALGSENNSFEPNQQQTSVAERSIMSGLFKVVNPARPVSPMNSRLLSLLSVRSDSRARSLVGDGLQSLEMSRGDGLPAERPSALI
jgi:hypothetical protein